MIIKPLQLGRLTLPNNLIQGPLAGYSCAPFRQLIWQLSDVGYCTTEMLSAHNIVHRPQQPLRYRYRDPSEKRLCVQLAGHCPDILGRASSIVSGWGAEIIDLNCGCPQPKIRKRKMGSRLLADTEKLYQCVLAMRAATDAVLTVKIRIDGDSGDVHNQQVAEAIAAAGADALIVHGRHWTERYDVPARWDEIGRFASWVSIPVIANGDVDSIDSLRQVITRTDCAGVMISRASLGRPWLFARLMAQGDNFVIPGDELQAQWLLEHVQGLIRLDGEQVALLQARKLVAYYFPTVKLSDRQVMLRNQLATWVDLQALVASMLESKVAT